MTEAVLMLAEARALKAWQAHRTSKARSCMAATQCLDVCLPVNTCDLHYAVDMYVIW